MQVPLDKHQTLDLVIITGGNYFCCFKIFWCKHYHFWQLCIKCEKLDSYGEWWIVYFIKSCSRSFPALNVTYQYLLHGASTITQPFHSKWIVLYEKHSHLVRILNKSVTEITLSILILLPQGNFTLELPARTASVFASVHGMFKRKYSWFLLPYKNYFGSLGCQKDTSKINQ